MRDPIVTFAFETFIARERPERAPRQPDRTDVSSWRRETPLELPERRGGGFRGGRGGFDRRGGDTSWRGGAFTRRDDRFGKFFVGNMYDNHSLY